MGAMPSFQPRDTWLSATLLEWQFFAVPRFLYIDHNFLSTFRSISDTLCEMVEAKRYFFAATGIIGRSRSNLKFFSFQILTGEM